MILENILRILEADDPTEDLKKKNPTEEEEEEEEQPETEDQPKDDFIDNTEEPSLPNDQKQQELPATQQQEPELPPDPQPKDVQPDDKKISDSELDDEPEEIDYTEYEIDEDDLAGAFDTNKPYMALKEICGEALLPKAIRWFKEKLKTVKVKDDNVVGGNLKAKLDAFLKKSEYYNENAKALAREFIHSFDQWKKQKIKDDDLPMTKGVQGENENG